MFRKNYHAFKPMEHSHSLLDILERVTEEEKETRATLFSSESLECESPETCVTQCEKNCLKYLMCFEFWIQVMESLLKYLLNQGRKVRSPRKKSD